MTTGPSISPIFTSGLPVVRSMSGKSLTRSSAFIDRRPAADSVIRYSVRLSGATLLLAD